MNGYGRWHAASAELFDLIQTWGPRIAYAGAVCLVLVLVPILARVAAFSQEFTFFPGLR